MNIRTLLCRTLPCLGGMASAFVAPHAGMAEEPAWIGPANNAFGCALYAKIAAGGQGNLFFSPNSIETALAMTYAGARGKTAAEMAAVLHLPPNSDSMQKDFVAFLNGLEHPLQDGTSNYELSVANALWGQKGFGFLPGFLSLLKSNYGAGLEQVDFKQASEAAREKINVWVEKQTRGKITNLIAQGVLTPDTRLVLTNAIYFKGSWETPFAKEATQNEPFHLSTGGTKSLPMMHRTAHYGYFENDDFQALKIGYVGQRLSMIILLPRKADGLPRLEGQLTPRNLAGALGSLDDSEVIASIPKFRLENQFELGPALASMGMKSAFSGNADFSGMTGKRNVAISNVIHKAYVDVNEEGTVAAAATGVVMTMAMARAPQEPEVFRADHPFIFLIRDEQSGAFLFMGRVMDPS